MNDCPTMVNSARRVNGAIRLINETTMVNGARGVNGRCHSTRMIDGLE